MAAVAELCATILGTLPVPPMPMLVSRRTDDEQGTTNAIQMEGNTHDLIVHLLIRAAAKNDADFNDKRKIVQHDAHETLFTTLDALPIAQEHSEQVWHAFCAFYRGYIGSFLDTGDNDIRFAPQSNVVHQHPLRMHAVSHAKAQDERFGIVRSMSALTDDDAYSSLILRAALRISDSKPNTGAILLLEESPNCPN